MTRQCAWCDRFLSFTPSATQVTHGICEQCAEQIRHSVPFTNVSPRSRNLLLAAKARLRVLLQVRSQRWFHFFRVSGLFGWMSS